MGRFETIAAGGASSRVYAAGDDAPGAPGVVVFHPWWGLNEDLLAYADRVAAAGFAVVAGPVPRLGWRRRSMKRSGWPAWSMGRRRTQSPSRRSIT